MRSIREIFLDNARGDGGKGIGLQQDIDALKLSIRETILSDYLRKCGSIRRPVVSATLS